MIRTKPMAYGLLMTVMAAVAPATPLSASSLLDPAYERHVIADPRSGLALFGYDPVAYHIEGRALEGDSEVEAVFAGLTWRFQNQANRAAFLADPQAYLPRFGGHDASRVGEGVMVTGDPEVFVIASGQLVLFRNLDNRDRFVADRTLREEASRRWPGVARQNALH